MMTHPHLTSLYINEANLIMIQVLPSCIFDIIWSQSLRGGDWWVSPHYGGLSHTSAQLSGGFGGSVTDDVALIPNVSEKK